ncbi:MAG: T9SS type A sorting domain-containing protein, partial [bacterium]
FVLPQNFPNPFNPATTIRYGLPKAERVTLKIYNLLGEEVVTLMNDELQAAGYHVAIWDGRNKLGEVVGSGVYIYRFRAGSFTSIQKMALVK